MVYILAFLFTLIFEYYCEKYPLEISFSEVRGRKIKNYANDYWKPIIFRILLFLPFFLVAALRYNVGTDYITYTKLQIPEVLSGDYSRIELIYIPFIWLFCGILNNNQLLFALIHFVILYYTFKAIQTNSQDKYLSIFLLMFTGVFNFSLNIMRQSIATAIILYALKILEDDDYKKFTLAVIIAFLFHKSALIYLILILLKNLRVKLYILPSLATLCFLFKNTIKSFIVYLASFTSYGHYFENKWWDKGISSTVMILINVLLLLIFYFILYRNSQYYKNNIWKKPIELLKSGLSFLNCKDISKKDYLYLNIQLFTTLVSSSMSIIPNGVRVNYLFVAFQIITVPYFIKKVENKKIKYFLILIIIISYLVMFYRYFILRNMGETFPYQSIF